MVPSVKDSINFEPGPATYNVTDVDKVFQTTFTTLQKNQRTTRKQGSRNTKFGKAKRTIDFSKLHASGGGVINGQVIRSFML